MSRTFSSFLCPLCGKTNHINKYDPSDYEETVIGLRFRGLGRGRGFEIADEGSLLESDSPVVDLIAERVKVLHTMFYANDDDEEELLDAVNKTLGTAYETPLDALADVFSQLEGFLEEDEPDEATPVTPANTQPVTQEFDNEEESSAAIDHEITEVVEDEDDEEALSELDYEIRRGEAEEES